MQLIKRKAPFISFSRYDSLPVDLLSLLNECSVLIDSFKLFKLDSQTSLNAIHLKLNKDIHSDHSTTEYQAVEVSNLYDTLLYLIYPFMQHGVIHTLDTKFILNLHSYIGYGLDEFFRGDPGKLRKVNVSVRGNETPDFSLVPSLVKALFIFYNKQSFYDSSSVYANSIINGIVLHLYFDLIHPFEDGNGRTSRILLFYIMLLSGMPVYVPHLLINFYNTNRHLYCENTIIANNTLDFFPFIHYSLTGFLEYLTKFHNDLNSRFSVV